MGSTWRVVRVGALFRQRREGRWRWPETLNGRRAGFGLANGTQHQQGGAGPAQHFVGLRTGAAWTRYGAGNWWDAGWELIRGTSTATEVLASGTGSTLRVAASTGDGGSAWYARLERSGGSLLVELFLPYSTEAVQRADFEQQMARPEWSRTVNGHSRHQNVSLIVDDKAAIFGQLDSVGLFSGVPQRPGGDLGPVEFLAAMATMIE